jgi:hypothetical protein
MSVNFWILKIKDGLDHMTRNPRLAIFFSSFIFTFFLKKKISTLKYFNYFYFLYHINNFLILFK